MNKKIIAFSVLLFSSSLFPYLASAQTSSASQTMQRMDRLERDLQIIQRQLSRGGVPEGISSDAQLEVRISAIEDELRSLRGKIEENEFQTRKLSEDFERMQRDIEFRFNDLTRTTAELAASKTASPQAEAATSKPSTEDEKIDTSQEEQAEEKESDSDNTPAEFATPREHYNHAFRLLNQTKYQDAAESFDEFTKRYPKDPLVGNAYYWLGETHYIRRDYVNAADMFRQGFESLPDGPKAADNLLKLAMSLNALKRDKEACVVLEQLSTRFTNVSKSIAARAKQEQKRIDCK